MIPKAKRLTKADFSKRPLRRAAFPFGSVQFFAGEPKVAVIVSKKVAPKAVDRNKLRRRCYSALRSPLQSGIIKNNIRVYPNAEAAKASFRELTAGLEKVLGA